MAVFDPSRLDLAPYGFSCVRWVPSVMRRPDRHNEIELNFLTKGWITYLFGGRIVRIEPHRLTAFWAAVPHQIVDHGNQGDYFVITLPLSWFLSLRLADSFVQTLMHGQMATAPAQPRSELAQSRLATWEEDFNSTDAHDHRAALLEIEAMVRRLSLSCQPPSAVNGSTPRRAGVIPDGALAKAGQIAQLVANRYAEPVDAVELSRQVDLVPKRAMKLFRMVFGNSVSGFLAEYRIAQAQRLLVTTSTRIVDVSEATGFGSLSRFNRAFLRICGCPPREYRKRYSIDLGQLSHGPVRKTGSAGRKTSEARVR